ncbi:MAG TPA: RNA polymerase sigma factor SigJ [Vicinamibacterales bacterium]|jgi:RNA polymerase sigma-70 factor (TIGR02957 family)|nr:RNA polymerase sigma factor SigJ [Vicinamibacterales bacterium]
MDTDVFNSDRPLLFSIAYRMLGSASDAEDVLQDAWLRYRGAEETALRSPRAFATTIVTRLCLDRLKSARTSREKYVGPWLPEPVLTSELERPDCSLQRAESVTFAFLVLLETMSPEERAVFLLKDVFEYAHSEIAEMLGITVDNSRQLLHRAKARLADARPQLSGTDQGRRAVAERFARAFASGDAAALTALLTSDAAMWSDGGGKVTAARRPVVGREAVVNFLVGVQRSATNAGATRDASLAIEDVNSEPALVVRVGRRLESIFVLSIEHDTISAIRVARNPDKLAHIDRQLRH